jgi:hypothetical protein
MASKVAEWAWKHVHWQEGGGQEHGWVREESLKYLERAQCWRDRKRVEESDENGRVQVGQKSQSQRKGWGLEFPPLTHSLLPSVQL